MHPLLLILTTINLNVALAEPVTPQDTVSVPCAVIGKLAGHVQILDSSRTHLIDATQGAGVPCEGWVSTGAGWAELKHRDGYKVHVGSQTFVEFPENNPDGKYSGDHVVIYRGQIYAQAPNGAGEFRAITANGRARMKNAVGVVLFNHESEETQLIALENWASLENRFQQTRQVKARAGEATALNLRLLRVIPSAPRAMAIASLRPKLDDMHVDAEDQSRAVEWAKRRADRRWASSMVETDSATYDELKPHDLGEGPVRKVASVKPAVGRSYVRHQSSKKDSALRDHWVRKMVAGQEDGEKILFPDKFYGRPQQVKVDVVDVGPAFNANQKVEAEEKRKLIEELSRIRED